MLRKDLQADIICHNDLAAHGCSAVVVGGTGVQLGKQEASLQAQTAQQE